MKKEKAEELIQNSQMRFKCPICGGVMGLHDHNSMICMNRHSFDLSKTGHMNLLASGTNTIYSKELFEARREVCLNGFFDPLIEKIYGILQSYRGTSSTGSLVILDAGCGEGSHLSNLYRRLAEAGSCIMFGIDIAKEGIKIASKNEEDILWIVADLAKLPFRNSSFDVLLNILSPANYIEFERVLSKDGIIVKVVPGESYLIELRKLLNKDNNYSNERVVDYFSNKLELISKESIQYKFNINKEILTSFIKMTPLTWGSSIVEINDSYIADITSVTADFTIITGRKGASGGRTD